MTLNTGTANGSGRVKTSRVISRLTSIAGYSLITTVAWVFCLPVRAAEQPAEGLKAADESPTVRRILANWRGREQQVKSLHFVWDSQFTAPKGTRVDYRRAPGQIINQAIHDDVRLDIPQSVFWLEGVEHFRTEFRLPEYDGREFALGTRCRGTYDGKVDATLELSDHSDDAPNATIWKDGCDHESRPACVKPLMLAMRPASLKGTGANPERFRLITENAIIDDNEENLHCVKIEKHAQNVDLSEICWVDPARDDIIVRCEISPGRPPVHAPLTWVSIEYQKGKEGFWVPIRWRTNLWGHGSPSAATVTATVTKYTINENFAPDTFAPSFPPGTVVTEQPTTIRPKK